MRPNTPQAVYTPDPSIVLGGHFYLTSNIQDMLWAIVHCFMGNNIVTNVEHGQTKNLLLRMLQFFYKCFILDTDGEIFFCTVGSSYHFS